MAGGGGVWPPRGWPRRTWAWGVASQRARAMDGGWGRDRPGRRLAGGMWGRGRQGGWAWHELLLGHARAVDRETGGKALGKKRRGKRLEQTGMLAKVGNFSQPHQT